jgi:hypothetical protein
LCTPVGAKFLCGRQTSNKKTNKIASLPLLASLSPFTSFFAPREALAVLEAVGAVTKMKSLQSQQLLLLRSRQYSPNIHSQQESTPHARDGPRQDATKTTQATHSVPKRAWLLDCHPRDRRSSVLRPAVQRTSERRRCSCGQDTWPSRTVPMDFHATLRKEQQRQGAAGTHLFGGIDWI